jgi:hypothetical protein
MDTLPPNWPVWAVIAYLFMKDALPILAKTFENLTGVIITGRSADKKLAMDRQVEIEEKRLDLREREVVALEQIGKTQVGMELRLQSLEKKTDLLTTGLVTANQALAIMMDRVHLRRREDYIANSPVSTPQTIDPSGEENKPQFEKEK